MKANIFSIFSFVNWQTPPTPQVGRDAADRPRAGAGGGGGVPGEGGGLRLRVRAGRAQRPRARRGHPPLPALALIVDIMLVVEYLFIPNTPIDT